MENFTRWSSSSTNTASTASHHPSTTTSGNNDKNNTNTSANSSSNTKISMATMAKGVTGMVNLTKKVSTNMSKTISNNIVTATTSNEHHEKRKSIVETKNQNITQVMTIIQDVHLVCPSSHAGFILAYNGTSLSPIINSGIKFTWYRMSGEDKIDPIEGSYRAWYAPTVDDIGCIICAQCEDNFDQGCSRYNECGPIKADALLCSVAENAIDNGSFETTGICVSVGIAQAKTTAVGLNNNQNSVTDLDMLINSQESVHKDTLSTVLSKEVSFLQFDGRSTVDIDEFGIFISIPTFDNEAAHLEPTQQDSKNGFARFGLKKNDTKSTNNKKSKKYSSNNHKTSRRGLRIPASSGIKVSCAQPLSLVLTVPIKRESTTSSAGTSGSNTDENDEAAYDEKMRKFLSSSTVQIPWTYEGHNHSPEAYAEQNESQLSAEEKEEMIKEMERDSIIFASTVCSLAEFISSLPEGTEELSICFSCGDRLIRDTLVLSIRALVMMPTDCTRPERKKVFPWISESGEVFTNLLAISNETDKEVKKRLKAQEESNHELKRERNELTVQLVESREEILHLKSKISQIQNNGGSTNIGHKDNQKRSSITSSSSNGVIATTSDSHSSLEDQNHNSNVHELGSKEAFKQLSSKIIELENKLAIANKREAESSRIRSDIESKNTKLHIEKEKFEKSSDEYSRKLTSLQSLYDHQTETIRLLELDQEKTKSVILQQDIKLEEMEVLRNKLEKKIIALAEATAALEAANLEIEGQKMIISEKNIEIQDLDFTMAEKDKRHYEAMTLLEKNLSDSIGENKKQAEEIIVLKAVVAEYEVMKVTLKDTETERDKLAGEVNHLQQKADSLSRDLKKYMKDSAVSLAEFERALVRKTEECDELYLKIDELERIEKERVLNEQNSMKNRMYSKFKDFHRTSISGNLGFS